MSNQAAIFIYSRYRLENATMPTKQLMLEYAELKDLAIKLISGNY